MIIGLVVGALSAGGLMIMWRLAERLQNEESAEADEQG